ncbi:unnamed protein product [Kuraishia capsulata CBS 1993]|uniref:MATE efflux family protein n=1 Tax=Kuraishia capsulata CBS 1993 TaxID=1382522 RepID=W6MT93_9ASCO|nr:uncharacterized protein KUCA_T00005611001 [Kuraishia capsulata CBS 1993]CDK29618.1 unnamed protein product [Kuraishia capsulata CBS 1993]
MPPNDPPDVSQLSPAYAQPIYMNAEAAVMANTTSQRRGSIRLSSSFNPRPINFRGSFSSHEDEEETTGLLTDTANGYGAAETAYIQTRRSSLASRKGSLAVIPSNYAEGTFSEAETSYSTEFRMLTTYSVPLVVTFLLQYSLTVASVFSVGQLGKSELAAVSLASMTANISAYGIIQGISTCLDTLCPQAYGRNDYKTVGLYFMRCTALLFLVYAFIFVLWVFFSEMILIAVIPERELCGLASQYLRILVWGVPGFIIFENLKHYLQAQGIFHASTYVLMVCAPMNMLLNYELVWNPLFGIGYAGAPIAVVITNWIMAGLLALYTWRVRGYECWCGFTPDIFRNWHRMLALAGPGVLMVEAEWLAFEIITFSASRFGTVVLAAQSVVSTTCVLVYQIPFAISIAASTRVAWFIGSASKDAARIATHCAMIIGLGFGVLNAIFLATFRRKIASLFSSDPDVIDLASQVLIIGAIYQVNDSLSCMSGGVLRGQGRQHIGGWLNLFSYYFLALPVAFLCAFGFHMELFGLWIGMVIALFFISISQSYFVLTADWSAIIKQSVQDAITEHTSGTPLVEHNLLSPSVSVISNDF